MINTEILRNLAEKQEITKYQIYKETGISTQYLSNLFNGKMKNPSVEVARKLADILGVKVDDLLE